MGDEPGRAHCNRISAPGYGGRAGDEDGRFEEWEFGLPGGDDLVPLSQSLIPPELAAAFKINAEPGRSTIDLDRAAQHTFSSLRRAAPSSSSATLRSLRPSPSASSDGEPSSRKFLPANSAAAAEEVESSFAMPEESKDEHSARTLKRPRLVWTPQLHKRFVDVVAHLGIKNAVPKTIMQLMNVEGLTRENVASHLQKYRLYLKRMQGLSSDGPSPSDHLFASTPVPHSLRENHHHHQQQQPLPVPMQMPVPYPMPAVIPVPVYGNPMAVVPVNNHHQAVGGFSGFEGHHAYGAFGERAKDW